MQQPPGTTWSGHDVVRGPVRDRGRGGPTGFGSCHERCRTGRTSAEACAVCFHSHSVTSGWDINPPTPPHPASAPPRARIETQGPRELIPRHECVHVGPGQTPSTTRCRCRTSGPWRSRRSPRGRRGSTASERTGFRFLYRYSTTPYSTRGSPATKHFGRSSYKSHSYTSPSRARSSRPPPITSSQILASACPSPTHTCCQTPSPRCTVDTSSSMPQSAHTGFGGRLDLIGMPPTSRSGTEAEAAPVARDRGPYRPRWEAPTSGRAATD